MNAIVVSSEHLLAGAIGRLARDVLGVAAIVLDKLPPTAAATADLLLIDEHVLNEHATGLDELVASGAKLVVFGGAHDEWPPGMARTHLAAYFSRHARESEVEAGLRAVVRQMSGPRPASGSPREISDERFTLTMRERAILRRLARGATTAQVAEELYVSPSTIKTQLQGLYRKLDVHSRSEAVLVLASNDLLHLLT